MQTSAPKTPPAAALPPTLGAISRQSPLHHVHVVAPFDRFVRPIDTQLATMPSMMSLGEKQLLHHLAKDYYDGRGIILDAGIFLGASTACFGAGIAANPHQVQASTKWGRPIVSCELGITNGQMLLSFKRHGISRPLKVGDSFGPVIEDHIAPWRQHIELRLGDIMKTGKLTDPTANNRVPVEILFLDVLKGPDIGRFALREYFPRLIPRHSILIQQDYLNGELPFVHVMQERFADKFEFVGELASSAVFRLVHRITRAEIEAFIAEPPSPEAQISLVAKAIQRSADPYRRFIMSLSLLRTIMNARGTEAARSFLNNLEIEYAEQVANVRLRRVQNVLRACRYLCDVGPGSQHELEAVKISTGHRGGDHRRTDLMQQTVPTASTSA